MLHRKRDTRELRRTCYNALLKTEYTSTTTPIPSLFSPFQRGLPANRSTERPASNSSLLETDELVFALKPAPGNIWQYPSPFRYDTSRNQ